MSSQNFENRTMTKEEIISVIGNHATFASREKLAPMELTKKRRYLMVGLRVYIIAMLGAIVLSILGLI